MEMENKPKKLSLVRDDASDNSNGTPDAGLAIRMLAESDSQKQDNPAGGSKYYYDEHPMQDTPMPSGPMDPVEPPQPVTEPKKNMTLPSKRILAAAAIIVVGLVGWLLLAGSSSARDGKYTFYYVEYQGIRLYAQDYEELADGYFKIKGKKAVFDCMDYHIECKISWNKNHMVVKDAYDSFDAEYSAVDQTITLNDVDGCTLVFKKQQ